MSNLESWKFLPLLNRQFEEMIGNFDELIQFFNNAELNNLKIGIENIKQNFDTLIEKINKRLGVNT